MLLWTAFGGRKGVEVLADLWFAGRRHLCHRQLSTIAKYVRPVLPAGTPDLCKIELHPQPERRSQRRPRTVRGQKSLPVHFCPFHRTLARSCHPRRSYGDCFSSSAVLVELHGLVDVGDSIRVRKEHPVDARMLESSAAVSGRSLLLQLRYGRRRYGRAPRTLAPLRS